MTTAYSKPGRSVDKASAADIVEGGLFQSLGNLCFRSVYSEYLWNTSVSAPYRIIRVAAMTLISLILLVRSWRLFIRPSPDVAMVLAPISAAGWQFGMFRTIALLTLALLLTLAKQLASTPEVNSGHRAGGKGYEGEHIENTLEALRALINKDNETPGGLKTLAYIEFDVHETGDGELVVLHDLHSVLTASQQFEINKGVMGELAAAGLQPEAPATSTLGGAYMVTLLACRA